MKQKHRQTHAQTQAYSVPQIPAPFILDALGDHREIHARMENAYEQSQSRWEFAYALDPEVEL